MDKRPFKFGIQMKPAFACCLSFLLCFFGWIVPARAWERVYDFEKDPVDYPPEGFVVEEAPRGKAHVRVQNDPADTPSTSRLLALCGSAFPGVNSLLCLAWFSNVKDGSASIDFRHGGEEKKARTAGLVWRYQSPEDTYSVEWNTLKSVLTLAVTNGGKRKILETEDVSLPPNEWTTLRVEFRGDAIRCNIKDKTIFDVKDSRLTRTGKVGILVQSDEMLFFDNLRVVSDDQK